MATYDFSHLDFSAPELAERLAAAYAILLELPPEEGNDAPALPLKQTNPQHHQQLATPAEDAAPVLYEWQDRRRLLTAGAPQPDLINNTFAKNG